jgi:hypothetical protein
MAHRADKTADFVGLFCMEGDLGGRPGTFVMRCEGTFDGGTAKGKLQIISGLGTGQLSGLTGSGSFEAPLGPVGKYSLECAFG